MASDVRPQQIHTSQTAKARALVSPGQLKTSNLTRNPRYSYLETPVEMQGSTFKQFSSPTNSTIDESPISPRDEYDPRTVIGTQMQAETVPERTGSPYGFPPPQQVHPAYFAPFSEDSNTPAHIYTQPADLPSSTAPARSQTYEDVKAPNGNLEPQTSSDRKSNAVSQPIFSPPPRQATQIYAPDSLGGPNGTLENHRPGQVAHPNSTLDHEWKNGLCDPDATCCLSLFCPCIVYGKTQYRLSRKSQKQDPTDMLGYDSFNGSCGIMAVTCGFQCMSMSCTQGSQ